MARKLKPKKCLGMHQKESAGTITNRVSGVKLEYFVCSKCGKEWKKVVR